MTTHFAPATANSLDIPPGYGRLHHRVVLVFGAGSVGEGWGNGQDIARAAVFLASNDESYITGVCLPVDGGLSCGVA